MAEDTLTYSPGLEGVIAGETTISFVNPQLVSLMYRGYDIRDLVNQSTFEETAFLLLYGHLPSQQEYDEFTTTLKKERTLPKQVVDAFYTFPKNNHPMDLLRAGVSLLALHDPENMDTSHDANIKRSVRLLAKFPAIIAHTYRICKGQDPVEPDNTLGHSENFLYMLQGEKPDPHTAKLLDATLICYAEHGFNASTFCGRVTVSTLSGIYSGTVSAIGTLKGPLHGGANEEAMKMLQEIGSVANAEKWVLDALATKKKIMGFGHRAYKTGDPRAAILTKMAREQAVRLGDTKWADMADIVEATMKREKNIIANVDFPTSYMYYQMGLPIDIYTPIFALSRISGWCAHMVEQLDNNRLVRPKAIYNGPQHVDYVPIEQR